MKPFDQSQCKLTEEEKEPSFEQEDSPDSDDNIPLNTGVLSRTQGMLDGLRDSLELPVNFKPRSDELMTLTKRASKPAGKIMKNEDYYLDQCPIELVSISLKFIVEVLTDLELVSGVEEIPHSISRLLYLANGKSDLLTEKDIYDNYLLECKSVISDELRNLKE